MINFELINPSDEYHLEAPDLKVAAIACLIIGGGAYGLLFLDGSGEVAVPLFIFGGHDEWFIDKFRADFETTLQEVLGNRCEELCACLESFVIPNGGERSSMNSIGRRAKETAKRIQEQVLRQ